MFKNQEKKNLEKDLEIQLTESHDEDYWTILHRFFEEHGLELVSAKITSHYFPEKYELKFQDISTSLLWKIEHNTFKWYLIYQNDRGDALPYESIVNFNLALTVLKNHKRS